MFLTLPRSFGSFGKPRSSIALRIARPVLGSLAGAAASWALYSFVRNGRPKLASPPTMNPDPISTSQPSGEQSHHGLDWTHAVLEAMKKEPRDFGYAKVEWNAPLLSQYLEKHHGQSIPANRVREALKDSGYEWHVSRYRKAHH